MATQFLSLNDIRRSKSARNNPILKGSRKVTGANIQAPSPAPGQGLLITFDTDITTNQFGQSTVDVAFDSAANYSGLIEWGDGSSDEVLSGTGNTGITHIFGGTEIIVQVRVSGSSVPKFVVQGSSNIISVENLGNVGLIDSTYMFDTCNNLATASTGNYITSIGNFAFNNCNALTSATIGNSVTSIGSGAFFNCNSLTSATIGNSVTSIGNGAFNVCSSLTSITIPNSVTSIGRSVFSGCSSLTSINIGNYVTSIGNGAFNSCNALTSIIIPNSVTSIGQQAFDGCTVLATVDLSMPKSVIDGAANIFLNTASPLTLNVPTGTTGWTAGTGQSIGGNTNVTVNLV